MCAIFPKWDVGIVVPTDKIGKETTESGHNGSAGPIAPRQSSLLRVCVPGKVLSDTHIFIYLTKLLWFHIQMDGELYIRISVSIMPLQKLEHRT